MEATVIDTLRYADRLKAAGVESPQAEAMSRALNDELAGGVATKEDLAGAVNELKGEFGKLESRLETMDAKFESRFASNDARFESIDAKFEAVDSRFVAVDARFDAMDKKFDLLRGTVETQGRYVFLVLALVVALGLYNAVAPHVSAGVGAAGAESVSMKTQAATSGG